ncbi:MAG: GNAT family N-acetyltransferase [Gemmatimonadetes bacterium]|nr:GNAT family N-acetyltransferase [Gemmatimonadota bacterium]MBI2614874.1 GNAT family N-acetyltransferase [Gemmatimonadota bacterium]
MGDAPRETLLTKLRDGTCVLIRPVTPADKPLLREGFTRLSEESRYRRFMRPVKELSEADLDYLTRIDYTTHMAWVAVDPESPDHPGLGVARYIQFPHDPKVAEVAITVVDSHQGRGLGTILLSLITRSAVQQGIEVFVAHVLMQNTPMLKLFQELGGTVTLDDPGVVAVRMPLPRRVEDLPDSPAGKVFREVARGFAR